MNNECLINFSRVTATMKRNFERGWNFIETIVPRLSLVFQDDKTAFQEILFRCWFNLFDFLLRTDYRKQLARGLKSTRSLSLIGVEWIVVQSRRSLLSCNPANLSVWMHLNAGQSKTYEHERVCSSWRWCFALVRQFKRKYEWFQSSCSLQMLNDWMSSLSELVAREEKTPDFVRQWIQCKEVRRVCSRRVLLTW